MTPRTKNRLIDNLTYFLQNIEKCCQFSIKMLDEGWKKRKLSTELLLIMEAMTPIANH